MKIILNIIFVIFYLRSPVVKAQEVTEDSIQKIIQLSKLYLGSENDSLIIEARELINNVEGIIDKSQNVNHKIDLYILKSETNLHTFSFDLSRKYSDKAKALINKDVNTDVLSRIHEIDGFLLFYNNQIKASKESFLKALEIYKILNNLTEIIDVNYNLSYISFRIDDWEGLKKHALLGIEASKLLGKDSTRLKYFKIFLALSYFELDEIEEGEKILTAISKKEIDTTNLSYMVQYYRLKGVGFYKTGRYKLASEFFNRSLIISGKEDISRKIQNSKLLILESSLKQKDINNKRIIAENEANKIKLNKVLLLSGVVLILLFMITTFIQHHYRKKEKKLISLLQSRNKELKQANFVAEEAVKVKSVFLDTINHELRTPLSTIKGVVHLLKKEKLTDYQEEKIDILNFSSDHLISLIANIIDLNILNNIKVDLKPEVFDIKNTLNNLINSIGLKYYKNNNRIHRVIDHKIPDQVVGDVLKLSQIFINLIGNALKFTKDGDVYITAKLLKIGADKVDIYFEVKDTGIGIKNDHQEIVFEGFNQGDEYTNRVYGGTGLGLTIVKRILELHQSEINLVSKEGQGTTFSFSLTLNCNPLELDSNEESNFLYLNGDYKCYTILLVEDNAVNQLITQKIIMDYGFKCLTVETGEEAVKIIQEKSERIDVILMDIMLLGIDGFTASKKIKELNRNMNIIALTAINIKLNEGKLSESGIETAINKPIKPILLLKAIVSSLNINLNK